MKSIFLKLFFLPLLFILPLIILAQPKYEFRGVWIATVSNIDWPSSKYLSSDSQKAEFIKLLNLHQQNGMNAVIVQIRPSTDAFYPSQYEPWSEWLTGTQGKPPMPYYDPLEFMITETHKRGMEFHAWINPYRAEFNILSSSISATHITRLHPEWFLIYGDKKYFDPGNKEAQIFVSNVIRDVVRRYDIDAIHFDDYFYPYRIPGNEFPDWASFKKYGNCLSIDDWRRSNVDSIILLLSKTIKQENKYCKFGISPFGVWRNNNKDAEGSNTKSGQTNYDDLYADILLWLKMKWIDYITPQLYWEIGHKLVPFEVLTDWWARHSYGRQLYIGQGIYKATESSSYSWKKVKELPDQIKNLRAYSQIQGTAFFSSNSFAKNPNGWNDSLKNNYYHYPAIIPPMKWIDSIRPSAPQLAGLKIISTDSVNGNLILNCSLTNYSSSIKQYAIYLFNKEDRIYKLLPANNTMVIVISKEDISLDLDSFSFYITAISRTNNESDLSKRLTLKKSGSEWIVMPD